VSRCVGMDRLSDLSRPAGPRRRRADHRLAQPEASHLLLVESVAGTELTQRAYDAAVAERYLWHEFGDSCLLLNAP
jgi:hypothetical protein